MTWKRVIIFAVITAIVTAAMLIIPIFKDTSFENIGVSFEAWILFALIIIMNCKTPLEASLKTFVFFLISQPLIYLLQVPFYAYGWQIFSYYPRWFIYTVLCLPGGFVAWYVKKDYVLSALILSAATGLLGAEAVYYGKSCVGAFPKYLLTVIFCVVLALVLIFVLLKRKRNRVIALVLTLAVTVLFAVITLKQPSAEMIGYHYLGDDHTWTVTEYDGDIDKAYIDHGTGVSASFSENGSGTLTVTNEDGEIIEFEVSCDGEDGITFDEK